MRVSVSSRLWLAVVATVPAATNGCFTTSGFRPAASPPSSAAAPLPAPLAGCREESFTNVDSVVAGIACDDLRVVGQTWHAQTPAAKLVADLAGQDAQMWESLGARTQLAVRSEQGALHGEVLAEIGTTAHPAYGQLVLYLERGPDHVSSLSCYGSGHLPVERCRALFRVLDKRLPTVRDAKGSWNITVGTSRVDLSSDCYWKEPRNVFCREGQLSWMPAAGMNEAATFSQKEREKPFPDTIWSSADREPKAARRCRVLGQQTTCIDVRFKFGQGPFRKQVVDATYATILIGDHAMSVICSVDRGTVPEGAGALCGQILR